MIIPKGHRILVKKDPYVDTYGEMGIVVAADEKREKTGIQTGILVEVGDQAWNAFRQMDDQGREHNGKRWANPGDYVMFARFAGNEVVDPFDKDLKDLAIMNDDDVIAVIEEGTHEIKANPARQKVLKENK
jgi:co-chaperonin GroES (HSP10)